MEHETDENKVYDINNILLEAKKNRDQVDELERIFNFKFPSLRPRARHRTDISQLQDMPRAGLIQ